MPRTRVLIEIDDVEVGDAIRRIHDLSSGSFAVLPITDEDFSEVTSKVKRALAKPIAMLPAPNSEKRGVGRPRKETPALEAPKASDRHRDSQGTLPEIILAYINSFIQKSQPIPSRTAIIKGVAKANKNVKPQSLANAVDTLVRKGRLKRVGDMSEQRYELVEG